MINFNVLLAIILGFSVCLTDSQLCTIYQSNQEASFGQAFVRKNYIKTRIAYYANSHSTFQLELFKAGDINPNPGPTIIDSDTSQKCKQLYYPQRTTFTGSELHRLKNITGYQRLPSDVYDKVKALGISCKPPTKRGTRGGVKTKAWLRSQLSGTRLGSVVDGNDERKKVAHCPIPVRVRPHTRNSYTHERRNGVNFENLKLVETLSNAPSPVALHLWNARSVRNKTTELYDYVLQNDVDIMVITETWLRESDPTVITELSPPDFSFHNVARHGDAHGGLGFLFRTHLDLRLKQIEFSPKTFEFACVVDRCEQYRIIAVYRPPPSTTNGFTVKAFLDEIDEFLGLCSMLGSRVIILGDFNVHVDKAHLPTPRQFLESVTSSGFSQLVEEPTHDGDHTLDLVITKTGDDIVCNYNVIDKGMSDHFVVRCNLNIQTPPSSTDRVLIKSRNYRQIDSEKFLADLSSRFADFPESDVNDMLTSLYGAVQGVLNQHCPETTRRRKQRPCAPWYDDSVMASRQLKRALESKWRKSKLVSDRQNYINQKNKLNVIIQKAKRNYYTNVILESNCRNMFSTVSSLLGRSKHVLPVSDEPLRLCNDFANFFEGKVRSIRQLLDAHPPNQQTVWTVPDPDNVPPLGPVADDDLLLALTPVSDEDVKRVIKKSANKSCDLDVMPTWLLKANSEAPMRQSYYAAASYMDSLVGKLLQTLNETGFSNNTIVVLFGDHGWQLGEHAEWCKFSNYELATRVPLIVHIPGVTDKPRSSPIKNQLQNSLKMIQSQDTVKSSADSGMVVTEFVELVDLFPTLSDLAGITVPPVCPPEPFNLTLCSEGYSFAPLLEPVQGSNAILQKDGMKKLTSKRYSRWKNATFSQYPRPGVTPNKKTDVPSLGDITVMGYSMRTKDHHYTEWIGFNPKTFQGNWTDVKATELYINGLDYDQNQNVAADPKFKDIVKQLSYQLQMGWRESLPVPA